MITPLTIKDLFECMKIEMDKGHGDYIVFVTDDEEANGYHALWYKGVCPADMTEEERKSYEEYNCDLICAERQGNKDKAYYIG